MALYGQSNLYEVVAFGLKDKKKAGYKGLEDRGTASRGQYRAWSLLEQSGGQCDWVVRQRGEVRVAGEPCKSQ